MHLTTCGSFLTKCSLAWATAPDCNRFMHMCMQMCVTEDLASLAMTQVREDEWKRRARLQALKREGMLKGMSEARRAGERWK